MKRITLIVLHLFFLVSINAQTTATFTNGDGNNEWHTAENWDINEVPGTNVHAIIPSGESVYILDNVSVKSITNSGNITIGGVGNVGIQTNSFTNVGICKTALMSHNNKIRGIGQDDRGDETKVEINNSGNIEDNGQAGNLTFGAVSTFTNSGNISVFSFLIVATYFYNLSSGIISTSSIFGNFIIACLFFYNYGFLNALYNMSVTTTFGVNYGVMAAMWGSIFCIVNGYYWQVFGPGIQSTLYGNIMMACFYGLIKGQLIAGESGKGNQMIRDAGDGHVEIAVDTAWVVGDTAKIRGESIRFVFDYLDFIGIDSIKDIYANSKIEFYGTAGSILRIEGWNAAEDFIYCESGNIEIYSDSIYLFDNDINYYCHPNPIVGPSDTTFIQTYIESVYVLDSTGSNGSFKADIRSNSTGHRTFDYSIFSELGWVNTTAGTTQLLDPFQFDSLMVDYAIPLSGDTLTDTVMVILSIPGEYADTAYSYIRSYPSSIVGMEENQIKNATLNLNVYPNPFTGKTTITVNEDAIITITDINGKLISEFSVLANKRQSWLPSDEFGSGLYFINASNGKSELVEKVLYWVR